MVTGRAPQVDDPVRQSVADVGADRVDTHPVPAERSEHLEVERNNFDFFLDIPEVDRSAAD